MNDSAQEMIPGTLKNFRKSGELRMQEEMKQLRYKRDLERLNYELNLYQHLSNKLKQEAALKKKKPVTFREILPYLIVGFVFLVLPSFLVSSYKDEDVQVSINYDIGTITGGVLAGSAAIIAAMAFAEKNASFKTNKKLQIDDDNQLSSEENDSENRDE